MNRKHDEETNLVHDKEVGFHGENHNSLAEASNGSGHANEEGGHAGTLMEKRRHHRGQFLEDKL
ncbi:hypothetical protein FRX31_019196 [Thalictrum thalictroides]|uniref:Uncharacterized protein n=1 Tax=Thalictrum thalictroides TaxID=46969 RepID=A0A7J6W353_THATH|nr:hypothetical protein FRX31_019196 [Thalictrum thalictroides]